MGVGYTYFAVRQPKPKGTPGPVPFKTPGVENIEGAYQSGGATSTHTKAYGGTGLGQKDDAPRTGDGKFGTGRNMGMEHENIKDQQKPI